MITEFRRLVFSSSELKMALKQFRGGNLSKLHEGDIVEVEIIGDSPISARVRVENIGGTYETQDIELDASYLGAAMLSHCMRSQIPIPKSAVKTLERAGDCLALSFSINADPQPVSLPDD